MDRSSHHVRWVRGVATLPLLGPAHATAAALAAACCIYIGQPINRCERLGWVAGWWAGWACGNRKASKNKRHGGGRFCSFLSFASVFVRSCKQPCMCLCLCGRLPAMVGRFSRSAVAALRWSRRRRQHQQRRKDAMCIGATGQSFMGLAGASSSFVHACMYVRM